MDIKVIAKEMDTIIGKDALIEEFEANKVHAAIAWKSARDNRNSNRMHESGVSMEAFYLADYYRILFENEYIAKILEELGSSEFWKEAMSDSYSKELTTI